MKILSQINISKSLSKIYDDNGMIKNYTLIEIPKVKISHIVFNLPIQ